MSFGFLVSQILLAIFALTPDSAFGSGSESKLTVGPHDAQLADVRLHYVVAGHGPLVLVTSPGWGSGSLYLQRAILIEPEVLDDRPRSTIQRFLALWHDDPRYQHAVEAALAPRHSGDRSDEQLAAVFGAKLSVYANVGIFRGSNSRSVSSVNCLSS